MLHWVGLERNNVRNYFRENLPTFSRNEIEKKTQKAGSNTSIIFLRFRK
jgi:hypothetical protein